MSTGNGRSARRIAADPARERIAAAMIELVGDARLRGRPASRWSASGPSVGRSHFDRCFAGKEDCFLSVHDEVAAEFCERVARRLRRRRAPGTTGSGRRAGRRCASSQEDPARARFLVVEVNGAGSGAQARRDRILQRLADILDGGREELEKPDSVSRCTAEIVAGAIYGTVLGKVEDGCDRARRGLPPRARLHGGDALPRLARRRGRAAGPVAALGLDADSSRVWSIVAKGTAKARRGQGESREPRRPRAPRRACPPAATACRASSSPRTSASGSSRRWSTPSPSAATTRPRSPTSPKRPRSPAAPSTSTSPTRKPASSPPTTWSPTTSAPRCGPRPSPSRSGRSRCGRRWRRCCASSPPSPSWPASAWSSRSRPGARSPPATAPRCRASSRSSRPAAPSTAASARCRRRPRKPWSAASSP